jgi:hypothetical protein
MVNFRRLDGADRVVSQDTIIRDQRGGQPIRMAEEQAVVAAAESQLPPRSGVSGPVHEAVLVHSGCGIGPVVVDLR